MYYSSGDIKGYGYLASLLIVASSKINWLPVVAAVADADATTAITTADVTLLEEERCMIGIIQ